MNLKSKRIFIVEDNVNNKAVAQMLLERAGAYVMVDRRGTGIIDRLKQQGPFDAILLDLMLPNQVTGYEIFKQIRQVKDFSNVPIIAISAADASTAIPKAKSMGFSGFISKPIDFQLFPGQIYRAICGEPIWHTF
jgi:CheY-like chemotaxis protein